MVYHLKTGQCPKEIISCSKTFFQTLKNGMNDPQLTLIWRFPSDKILLFPKILFLQETRQHCRIYLKCLTAPHRTWKCQIWWTNFKKCTITSIVTLNTGHLRKNRQWIINRLFYCNILPTRYQDHHFNLYFQRHFFICNGKSDAKTDGKSNDKSKGLDDALHVMVKGDALHVKVPVVVFNSMITYC